MNVDIRPAAQQDIRSAAGNLVKGTLSRALGFFAAIERTLKKLAANPGLGAPCEFEAPGLTGLRVWPVSRHKNHLIFYLTTDEAIVVVRVLHGARDIEAIFDIEPSP